MLPICLLVVALVTLLYVGQRYALSHWQRNGFPSIPAAFPLGNLLDVFLRRRSFGLHMNHLYQQSVDHPMLVGIYFFLRPALLIKDAALVRRILTQDFHAFHDRGTFHNPQVDPLSGHMFNMCGAEWRAMRSKLTPTFTAGKLRSMLPMILAEGENLKRYLIEPAKHREVVQMKELLDKYALNIIASVGFGLEVDTIGDPQHEFLQIEKIVNGPGLMNSVRLALAFLCPSVLNAFRMSANCDEAREYFREMTRKTFEHRQRNAVVRKDFAQLLLQLHQAGELAADGDWNVRGDTATTSTTPTELPRMSIDECAAQSYLFYLAGFDTSSSALCYTLYELVRNPTLLKRLQREIDETLERHGGIITYDAIQEMQYMEWCICESVRKYPTLPILNRICTSDYAVPGTSLTIRAGTPVVVSLLGIGRDERYFPEPMRFQPERFAPDDRCYDEDAFLAFGEGPRMCIGLRLGKMIAKIGLVQLLRSYDFECVGDAEIEFHNFSVTMVPKCGVEIRVVERQRPS